MKKIIKNKKMILIVIIILLLLGYYIYHKNNMYEEFETSSNTEELLTYEEKKEENLVMGEGTNNKEHNSETEKIIVHITGEVKNAGVIELEKGKRIIDAVNMAGGFTEEADAEKINLAYELADGVKIYIPNKSEIETTDAKEYITKSSGDNVIMEESKMEQNNNSLININQASQTELETLPGIGPSTALKIVSYREENGNFSSIEDIKNVQGIGDAKFENIKELICI